MIGVAVFASFFQVNQAYKMADQVIDFDTRAILVQHQLERDLTGAFIPYVFLSQKETTTITRETVTTSTKKETTETREKEKKKKEEALKNAFFADQRDGNLDVLTFVTSNPLPAYDSIKPRVVRIIYQLVPEKAREQKQSYRLFRDEQETLLFILPGESPHGYEIARGIKSMIVQYKVQPAKEKKEEKKPPNKQAQEKKAAESQYETFSVWSKEQIEKMKRNMPHVVEVTLSFWDNMKKRTRIFTFKTAIVADDVKPKEIQKIPPKINKKIEDKTGEKPESARTKNVPARGQGKVRAR